MLSLSDIAKAYGGRSLFAGVSLQVGQEDRIGLVGPNGAGKSTLFAMLLGKESPDAGAIRWQRGCRVGHLPQENAPAGEETALELASGISDEMIGLQRRRRTLMAGGAADPAEIQQWKEEYEQAEGPAIEARARRILAGLAFRESDLDGPARELSGGWVMRAHLGRLLVQEPDLLMLDEPTNHLDLDALLWFQEHLRGFRGALLLISHDRDFLNQMVTSIVEIRQSKLIRYRGNYDAYLEQRESAEEQALAAYKHQQREIARLQLFVDRFRAKNTKATQAQSKLKQIARMEPIDAPAGEEAAIGFRFPQPARSGLRVVTLDGVRFAYGDAVIYDGLSFVAERGQRIVLVGPNGAGKSTLLKLLAGVLAPQAGERRLGHQVREGYFAQYRVEMLDPNRTVLDEAFQSPQRLTETFVRTVLGSFLFRDDDVFKVVRVLSGGEKSRLALVKLLLDPPNLLLMDEPTTHLDLASVDALLEALRQFEGTLIFISHDVYFIRELANHVVRVRDGRLTHYPGGYDYYLDKTAPERAAEAAAQAVAPAARTTGAAFDRKEQKRREAAERQARYEQRQAARELVGRLEAEIAARESRQACLVAELEHPDTYAAAGRAVEINQEMQTLLPEIERLTAQWEAAASALAALESDDAPGGESSF
ncbi:MAG TPA: ABC-F family ATP-binding cassette domain-containing protein [Candidatus Paceibacterota bacterium]|nr:ABC-F family ATP-binding cassette domain-containing protein [Verrucomicrobiota bacterium]HRZ45110.1 ABC-F family ATP-binding cassette domain-containing protein [Candidatus Paceibacterota bacterium]HRZ94604.1 ABC-F family ATP-binding cassette domain-containing protein [Candidatus Paceibacterota bacterium]